MSMRLRSRCCLLVTLLLSYVFALLIITWAAIKHATCPLDASNTADDNSDNDEDTPLAQGHNHHHNNNNNNNRQQIAWCAQLKYRDVPLSLIKPVALVSFPGSGNTWLRYLLQQATGIYTGSVYRDNGLLRNGFSAEGVTNGSVLVVKTHEWGAASRVHHMYSAAILLIRSPGGAILAEFNRQSGGHIGYAPRQQFRKSDGKYWIRFVDDKLMGWRDMNLDWIQNFTRPTMVVLYERLERHLETSLRVLLHFLHVPVDEGRLECALARQEGIFRRRKRPYRFEPYTDTMRMTIETVERSVYGAIYRLATPDDSFS